ncbi:MAG: aldo/keto reductase [Candidatus Heimdallarchaeota archaeon]|nr:aldo/keto reductase [Candidatus Heimdallarchaeota archaeon]MBY8995826.1 aldo/keto reductase [Candidatus Heimdallarchaeota archaeon]
MKKVKLKGTKIEITPIGIGVMQFSWGQRMFKMMGSGDVNEDTRNGIIKAAFAGGVNWFDTAEAYSSSEKYLASALKANGIKDKDVIIADKWMPMARTATHLKKSIEKRLTALDGFTIDIHQIHAPISFSSIKAQMNTMADLVESEKIRSIGVSNFSKNQMIKAHEALEERGLQLVSNQVKYSLLHRRIEKNGVLDAAKELGIKIISYSPLHQGVLTGCYHNNPDLKKNVSFMKRKMYPNVEKQVRRTETLMQAIKEIATKHNVKASQVSLNWLINYSKDTVVAIPGASKINHVVENVSAMTFELTKNEIAELDELSRPLNRMK